MSFGLRCQRCGFWNAKAIPKLFSLVDRAAGCATAVDDIIIVRVVDMYLIWIDADDWPIDFVQTPYLERPLAPALTDKIVIGLVPVCGSSELRARELCQGMQKQSISDEADFVDGPE